MNDTVELVILFAVIAVALAIVLVIAAISAYSVLRFHEEEEIDDDRLMDEIRNGDGKF